MKTKAEQYIQEDLDLTQFATAREKFRIAVFKELGLPFDIGSEMYDRLWNLAEEYTCDGGYCSDIERLDGEAAFVEKMWIDLMGDLWDLILPHKAVEHPLFTLVIPVRSEVYLYSETTGYVREADPQKVHEFRVAVSEALGVTFDPESPEWAELWENALKKASETANPVYPHVVHDASAKEFALSWRLHRLTIDNSPKIIDYNSEEWYETFYDLAKHFLPKNSGSMVKDVHAFRVACAEMIGAQSLTENPTWDEWEDLWGKACVDPKFKGNIWEKQANIACVFASVWQATQLKRNKTK